MNQEIELINKNTRNEKIKNFFKNNYKKIITFFTLVLIGIICYCFVVFVLNPESSPLRI